MLRNRVQRPFTVEVKSSGQNRRVSIPSKQPREPHKRTGRTEALALWPSLDAAAIVPQPHVEPVQEHRRILPSLIVAEVQEPATEPDELPRARRASRPIEAIEGAPRRRGRPRKVIVQEAVQQAVEVVEQVAPEPAQAVPETVPIIRRRPDRTGSETLRLGERWKRRLPKACW
ncbi:DNA-binding protein [Methylorubrum extorquens]|nr:DNA-binding protein [Methylorubrum extorquens]